jgi:hypothetical protein
MKRAGAWLVWALGLDLALPGVRFTGSTNRPPAQQITWSTQLKLDGLSTFCRSTHLTVLARTGARGLTLG